ncbi:MAG: replication-associated recombination protein A [Clostridia bacterium]|nr:replication-associated recombination protein A [Clostridia bacterium]
MPLADSMRPTTLEEVAGQRHLLGENGVLRKIYDSPCLPNLIFYGPSGTGKTTVANILARKTGKKLVKLNATTAGLSDIRDVAELTGTLDGVNGVLLYLDEIQYFNKKQQQSLLEFIEDGRVTLIASTTENPYFYIYKAVLSRCTVLEFKAVEPQEVAAVVRRAFEREGAQASEELVQAISQSCGGDVRRSLNMVELCLISGLTRPEQLREAGVTSLMDFDRDGDVHYDLLSAFQKSVRGSDADASVFYLAKLLQGGDLISVCRRLLVIAAEDVGLAYPGAYPVVKACTDAAVQLGLPEARIPLAEATLLLATAPKSNSAITAVDAAWQDIESGLGRVPPASLRDAHYSGAEELGRGKGYVYPHGHPNNWVAQQYLPDDVKERVYYRYGSNRSEAAARKYMEEIKK